MRKLTPALLTLLLLLILMFPFQVLGRPENIIITGADETRTETLVESTTLFDLISNVSSRIVIQYANDNVLHSLTAPPTTLQTLISQIADRIVIQYANDNDLILLDYPVALIGDSTPPQVSDVSPSPLGGDDYQIVWQTDEYAQCSLSYGESSGSYTTTVDESLFYIDHQLNLNDLTVGSTIYFQLTCVDRSDNSAQSIEYSFTPVEHFLPLIATAP